MLTTGAAVTVLYCLCEFIDVLKGMKLTSKLSAKCLLRISYLRLLPNFLISFNLI